MLEPKLDMQSFTESTDNSTDNIWKNDPGLIRKYLDLLPKHEKLCEEVQYILESKISESSIQISNITSRAKTLNSYCEKIDRKSYKDPLQDITDLAGVRVVFLYLSDLKKIEEIIEKEFDIIEKENKLENNSSETFGYGALHYLVRIKKIHTGARYDDLRNLQCEIQVRTILQDAWSIVAHHLSYKQEKDVPKNLIRKLNALSGLFETADDQFENLKAARSSYIEKIETAITNKSPNSLQQKINLDNLIAYSSSKFPQRQSPPSEIYAELLEELASIKYEKLSDLDSAIEKGYEAAQKYEKDNRKSRDKLTRVGIIRTIIALINSDYRESRYSGTISQTLQNYAPL